LLLCVESNAAEGTGARVFGIWATCALTIGIVSALLASP
jgi:hypothetical protein